MTHTQSVPTGASIEAIFRSSGYVEPSTFAIVAADDPATDEWAAAFAAEGLVPEPPESRQGRPDGDPVRWAGAPLRSLLDLPLGTDGTPVREATSARSTDDEAVFAAILRELAARPPFDRPYGHEVFDVALRFVQVRADGSVRRRWVTLWEVFEFTPLPVGDETLTLRGLVAGTDLDGVDTASPSAVTFSTPSGESIPLSTLLDTPVDDFGLALTMAESFAIPVVTDGGAVVPADRLGHTPVPPGPLTVRALFDCDLNPDGESVTLFDRATAVGATRSDASREWYDNTGSGFRENLTATLFDMPMEIEGGRLKQGRLYDGPELVEFTLWSVADEPLLLDGEPAVLEDLLDARIDVRRFGLDPAAVEITVRDVFEHDFREFGEYTGAGLEGLVGPLVAAAVPTVALGVRWVLDHPELLVRLVEVVLERRAKQEPPSADADDSDGQLRVTFVVGDVPVVLEGRYEDVRRYEREGLDEEWVAQLQSAARSARAGRAGA